MYMYWTLANYWLRSVIMYTVHVHASTLHYINFAKSDPLTECTRKISKQIKRNKKEIFKRKIIECVITSQCKYSYWLWSLVMVYMLQDLEKCSHSQSTSKSRSHNQIPFFFGSKSFFLAYQFELLQVFRFDSQFILRQNWFELMFLYNSLVAIVNKVGKLQVCVIISQCYWLWSLIMVYMLQDLAKCSHSQNTSKSRSHNQVPFFLF